MVITPLHIALAIFSFTLLLFLSKLLRKPRNDEAFQEIVESDSSTKNQDHLPELITIYLVPKKPIDGNSLLRFLLDHQLQYHHQQAVFHATYHDHTRFYVATLSSPGTFDLDTMAHCEFDGLSFFTQPRTSKMPLDDFDALCHILFEAKDSFDALLQNKDKEEISLDDLRELRTQLSQNDESLD